MDFEWDKNKNEINIDKHSIDFKDALKIFEDKYQISSLDKRKDYGEIRWKIIGKIFGTVISVIYTIRNTNIRIISARKASRIERYEYNNQ